MIQKNQLSQIEELKDEDENEEEEKRPDMRQQRDWQRLSRRDSVIEENEITKIVALTSYTNEKVKQDCYDAGIKEVFNKPINYTSLHRIMWMYFFRIPTKEYSKLYK